MELAQLLAPSIKESLLSGDVTAVAVIVVANNSFTEHFVVSLEDADVPDTAEERQALERKNLSAMQAIAIQSAIVHRTVADKLAAYMEGQV